MRYSLTPKIAHDAGTDAGNASMRSRGLTQWDDEALLAACRETNRVLDAIEKGDSNHG